MSLIRGQGNRTTELAMVALLRSAKATGWRRHMVVSVPTAPGERRRRIRPDFVFLRPRVALFVDGCFWHGCPWHSPVARHATPYWRQKIESNRRRDAETRARLRRRGWIVVTIWEHSLKPKNLSAVARRVLSALGRRPPKQ